MKRVFSGVKLILISLLVNALLIEAAVTNPESLPQGATVVFVHPENVTARVGDVITLSVNVSGVSGLYGFDLRLRWNTSILEYVNRSVLVPRDSHPGGVLWNPIFQVKNVVNSTAGTFWLAYACIRTAPSFNGSGTFFRMTFRTVGVGASSFSFYSTDLVTQTGVAIPHSALGGSVNVTARTKDVLIVDDALKRAFFGWYGASAMPSAGWSLLNKTLLWATSREPPNETDIVLLHHALEPDYTFDGDPDGFAVYEWLADGGYNVTTCPDWDMKRLSVAYYEGFDLALYWSLHRFDPRNITESQVPFISVCIQHTLDMEIGTGLLTMDEAKQVFYVVDTDYYPTQDCALGRLPFEAEMHVVASEASRHGKVLVIAEYIGEYPSMLEAIVTQNVSVSSNGSSNISIGITVLSPLAELYREAFFSNGSVAEGACTNLQEGGIEIPENKTVQSTVNAEEGVNNTALMGDVNGDGNVDIFDVVSGCAAYGSRGGEERWNALVDLAEPYGTIGIFDIVKICTNYGKRRQSPPAVVVPVREPFHQSIMAEQAVSLGFETEILGSRIVPQGAENETRISVDAYSPQFARSLGLFQTSASGSSWRINVGPWDANATEMAADYVVSKIQYMQLMLRSMPGVQVCVVRGTLKISLPAGAVLLNGNELLGLNWMVDFGGGTCMNASVGLDSGNVNVYETMVVTEESITASEEYLVHAFSEYKVFKIDYSLDGYAFAGASSGRSSGDVDTKAWEHSWTYTIASGSYSKKWSMGGLKATVSVNPKITAEWYVGWHFRSWQLQWFRTWMSITPSVTAYASVEATVTCSKTWSTTLLTWCHRFSFWVGSVPVWANLQLTVRGQIKATAFGKVACTVSVTASAWFKAGVEWIRGTGWHEIEEHGTGASVSGPSITGEAGITVTPSATCRLAFKFYDVAGPYVECEPYAPITAKIVPRTWSLSLKLKVTAGVAFAGWLEKALNLASYSKQLGDWTLASRNGNW